MPIFAYRCDSCGFAQDVLQKRSDPPLETCPSCAAPAFRKQLTAPAFQLKGSGWYVTDFRDSGKGKNADKPADGAGDAGDKKAADGAAPAPSPAPAPAATPAAASPPAASPAPAATPAGKSG